MNQNFIHRTLKYTRAEKCRQAGVYPYFREIQCELSTEVIINNQRVLMFGSNSYLGLTSHPKIKEACQKAIIKYGSSCCGSRFLNGTLTIHIELEEALKEYLNREAVLVFGSGFQSNLGTLPSLMHRNDYLLVDNMVHASVIDASRLSFAKVLRFKHNDLDHLEAVISKLPPKALKFIAVDGIYSMEGDIAPLPGIVDIAKMYNGVIVCDDAHAIGVIGEKGRGTGSHFGLNGSVDIQIGTFSKSLASQGGFVAASKSAIEYLKHTSRSLIFSASMTPASAAGVLAALDIIKSEPELIDQLWTNTRYLTNNLKQLGFDIGNAETPIIPLYIRDNDRTFIFTTECFKSGIFINPIISPAVPSNQSMIRISVMATHTSSQIDRLCEVLHKNAQLIQLLD